MKTKELILAFGYWTLSALCASKGWEIPTVEEVSSGAVPTDHRKVWVSDLPDRVEDRETHGLLYDRETDRTILCHKGFMHHAVVIVKREVCDG